MLILDSLENSPIFNMVPYHLSISFCAQIQHRPSHHVRVNTFFQKNKRINTKTAATAKYRAAVENLFDFRTAPLYNRESIAFKRL